MLRLAPCSATILIALGACGVPFRESIAERVAVVDAERIKRDVRTLCDEIGARPAYELEATEKTLAFLETELQRVGYKTRREAFESPMRTFKRLPPDEDGRRGWAMTLAKRATHYNLIAELRGRSEPDRVFEICAHYDTMPWTKGADDNASGMVAVLETARAIAKSSPERSIRFVFFAMEEEGLTGSRKHVELLRRAKQKVEGALVLDCVGFTNRAKNSQKTPIRIPLLFSPPRRADFIVVAGNWSSGWIGNLFESCADTYARDLRYYSVNRLAGMFSDASRGDHKSYWDAGYDAAALWDTVEYRSPHYHRPTDLPDTLDYGFLTAITRATTATALEWSRAWRK